MSVVISDDTLRASGMTKAEFKQEVALLLFASGKLPLRYASKLAEMDKIQFQQLLQERKIPGASQMFKFIVMLNGAIAE